MTWQSEGLSALLDRRLFTISGTDTTAGSALAVVAIMVATHLVARSMRRVAARLYRRHGVDDDIAVQTTATVLQVVVWLVGIEIVLHMLGIRLATLFATTGALALGAGFAIKNMVENWISGIVLRAGQTIRPGDVIVIDDRWLTVKKIGMRTTDALTFADEEVMIPNGLVTQSIVTNLTRHDRLYRIEVKVGVSYGSDIDLVRQTLETTVNGLEWRSHTQEPAVYLTEFAASSVNYAVYVWIDDVRHALKPASDLHEAVWKGLKQAGIVIAFPQLDVHLDPPSAGKTG
jgi:small-conductance mechanosensitive channel